MHQEFQEAVIFANRISFIQIHACTSLNESCTASVKKDLMRTFLFKSYQLLKFYIILSILHILIMFFIFQAINSFSDKSKPLPITAQKIVETADLVPFTEEILNGKVHFLCSASPLIFNM